MRAETFLYYKIVVTPVHLISDYKLPWSYKYQLRPSLIAHVQPTDIDRA